MGCCYSKSKTQNQKPEHKSHEPHHHLRHSLPKSNPTHELQLAPPRPPPLEEESVKEVLSETPISRKPKQVPILNPDSDTLLPSLQNPDAKIQTKDLNPNIITVNKKEDEAASEAVSQFSEVVSQLSEEPCSVSESFSAATTATVTEKREDEATSKRSIREGATTTTKTNKWSNSRSPLRKRPNAENGNVAGGRDRKLRSPARRAEPSPEKKIQGGPRPVRGREAGTAANRKLNVGPTGVRRDAGESSGRRSRSPASARAAGSVGKVGAGGGRKPVPTAAKAAAEKEEKKDVDGSEDVGEKNGVVSQEEESIENPLVSMECFIFL